MLSSREKGPGGDSRKGVTGLTPLRLLCAVVGYRDGLLGRRGAGNGTVTLAGRYSLQAGHPAATRADGLLRASLRMQRNAAGVTVCRGSASSSMEPRRETLDIAGKSELAGSVRLRPRSVRPL